MRTKSVRKRRGVAGLLLPAFSPLFLSGTLRAQNIATDCIAKVRSALLLVLSLFVWGAAYAQITPNADSYTNSATPTTNYGAKTLLDVDAASQITYIQFDLGSIPSGASVSQATLKLFVNSVSTAGSFNVDYVNGSWSEGSIDFSNAPPLGSTIASGVTITKSSVNQYTLINITPALQAWLNGSQTNDGIALVANGSFNATFDSKENTTTSHPAELDIVFAGSGGGTITGVLTGAGSGLTGGGTNGTLNLSLLTTCATSQVLQWTGSAWACSSAGTGTITGVTAGTDLTGGGTGGSVTLNLDTTKVPQLAAANAFTGNQTVNGNVSATGLVTGAGFNIGSNLFDFGSYANANAFLGFSGNTSATGGRNTASGYQALISDTTGTHNTASGTQSLYSNTGGFANTASGVAALYTNTTGNYNTAIGLAALYNNTTGGDNTGIGEAALLTNSTGTYNVGVGQGSGNTFDASPMTGSNNTFLGFATSASTGNLTNVTAIGANALVGESNALVLGGTGSNAVKVGIGTSTPASTLDVHGTGNFTGLITFAAGQTFPGAGTITGVTAGTDLTGGGGSGNVTLNVDTTKVVTGVTAGTDLTGGGTGGVLMLNLDTTKVPQLSTANTFTGNQTVNGNLSATGVVNGSSFNIASTRFVFGTVGNGNTFLGFSGNTTMTGGVDTATGWLALASNTTGTYNTADGAQTLYSNTTGNQNTASGFDALTSNTNGSYNTASGYFALTSNTTGTYNAAGGYQALLNNTTGANNTASGAYALYINSTGSYNTGAGAGSGVTYDLSALTGSYDTFLGYNAEASTGSLTNATAIGAQAVVGESNAIVLGSIAGANGATAGVNVGIGEPSPSAPLHITGPAAAPPIGLPAANNGLLLGTNGTASYKWIQSYGGDLALNALGNNVGIGTSTPDTLLSVNGNADKPGGGSWGTFSDRRLKTLDGGFRSGLSQILKINPVRYRYKEANGMGIRDREEHVGLVAQDVQKVIPEAVTENIQGYLLVNNDPILWAMLNAIKEQQREIRALRAQLRKSAARDALLESRLAELEQPRGKVTRLASARPAP